MSTIPREAFRSVEVNSLELGDYPVQYMRFSNPKTAHKIPIIIVCGAFHGFSHYSEETLFLMKEFPVFLVSLPGQGGSLLSSPELRWEDYSELLLNFMDHLGIEKAIPMSFGMNAKIALHFASGHPDRTHKLIIGGIAKEYRDTIIHFLEEGLLALEQGEIEKFAASMSLTSFNFSKQELIPEAKELFQSTYAFLSQLDDREIEKYKANIARALDSEDFPRSPRCEVLVLSGEFDNFTMPFEGFEVANYCSHAQFGMFANTDHWFHLESKTVLGKVVRKFIREEPIHRITKFELLRKKKFPQERVRLAPRLEFGVSSFLDSGDGVLVPVDIRNISAQGMLVFTNFTHHKSFVGKRNFKLILPDLDMEVDTILFRTNDEHFFRGIFKYYSIDVRQKFENLMKSVAKMEEDRLSLAS